MARARSPVLLVCWFDPAGINTPRDMVQSIRRYSRYPVTVLNLFGQHVLEIPRRYDLTAFAAVILHNTVSYKPENLRGLDGQLTTKLRDYRGVKILMKQDENYRFHETASIMRETGFDFVFTTLSLQDVPTIYPDMGSTRFERMLTGYVMPAQRKGMPALHNRRIDIGYRGSVQPLSFGRIAYEKQSIARLVHEALAGSDAILDISCDWDKRITGREWPRFLSRCKAILGVESGGSVFDLDGDLDTRCAQANAELGPERAGNDYAETYLAYLAPLEQRIDYRQIGPRHFEAAAAGAVQIMYPGEYSGIFRAGEHYFPLARDGSNMQEALAFVRDDDARTAMAERAYRDIILNPAYSIEHFIARIDARIGEFLPERMAASKKPTRAGLMPAAQRAWAWLPVSLRRRLKAIAKRYRAS